jgi:putative membrane protein
VPKEFLDGASTTAMRDAISAIEARSSAELVVSVRARSATYLHADILVGAVAALAALAFMLFSPFPFALHWFLIDPLIVGGLVALAASRLPPVRRALTPRSVRHKRVRAAADATFLQRGVHHTRDRTGILLYVSLLERLAVLIADAAVEREVPRREWRAAAARIDRVVAEGGDGAAVARALEQLGDLLALHLPRQAGDINELADEVDA